MQLEVVQTFGNSRYSLYTFIAEMQMNANRSSVSDSDHEFKMFRSDPHIVHDILLSRHLRQPRPRVRGEGGGGVQPRDQARHQDQGGEGVRAGAGRELQVRESSFQTLANVVSPRTELSTVYSEETRQDCTQVPAIVCQNVTSQQCGAKQKPVQETVTNTDVIYYLMLLSRVAEDHSK